MLRGEIAVKQNGLKSLSRNITNLCQMDQTNVHLLRHWHDRKGGNCAYVVGYQKYEQWVEAKYDSRRYTSPHVDIS